jgi:hypothetical protein
MRLKRAGSGGEFGSTVNGLKQAFSSLLQLHGSIIVAHGAGFAFEQGSGDPGLEVR